MRIVKLTYQAVVALAVFALVANVYHDGGKGFGVDIDDIIVYGVAIAVLAVPFFWAVTHLFGGVLFGIAAGGVGDGLKLGLLLGLGMSVGKLWPYVAAASAGVYVGGGPAIYAYGGLALALMLLALDKVMEYFWKSTAHGHDK